MIQTNEMGRKARGSLPFCTEKQFDARAQNFSRVYDAEGDFGGTAAPSKTTLNKAYMFSEKHRKNKNPLDIASLVTRSVEEEFLSRQPSGAPAYFPDLKQEIFDHLSLSQDGRPRDSDAHKSLKLMLRYKKRPFKLTETERKLGVQNIEKQLKGVDQRFVVYLQQENAFGIVVNAVREWVSDPEQYNLVRSVRMDRQKRLAKKYHR